MSGSVLIFFFRICQLNAYYLLMIELIFFLFSSNIIAMHCVGVFGFHSLETLQGENQQENIRKRSDV